MKNNNIKVEIDPDTADGITRCSLKQSIAYLREDIAVLKSVRKREYYQKHELGELIITLDAMEKTFDSYGGNLR